MKVRIWVFSLLLTAFSFPGSAYEHEDSLVKFVEYSDDVVTRNRDKNKPYFLLFSAEWCHWCHEFAENTLVRKDVADYLNENFINVFIDADIHNAAYVKYRATGLPFTVFLNPDGSLYYKYSGTLYGDDFLDVSIEVQAGVGVGQYALGMEAEQVSYQPPDERAASELAALPEIFRQGLLENFDSREHGLGRERKLILPRSFSYLLDHNDAKTRQQVALLLENTLLRAVDRIFDSVEGGFFRYAEKRNWQIPHYEKFADLNAGSVLLMYQLNQIKPSAKLKQAADQTLDYLNSTLYSSETGSFLSFQIADTYYYSLDREQREKARVPRVMDKIFTDRLALTLGYLMQIAALNQDRELDARIKSSLAFLIAMIEKGDGLKRYYSIPQKNWLQQSGLSDYAYLAKLFADAAQHFDNKGYADVAAGIMLRAIENYYSPDNGIFIDPSVDDSSNVEYLMEMNSLMALAIAGLGERLNPGGDRIITSILTYFSQMNEPLEEHLWNARDWDFVESYVPFLEIVEARNQ